jgi:hypothetical protein
MAQAVRFRCLTQKVRDWRSVHQGIVVEKGGTENGFASSFLVPFSSWLRRMAEKLSLLGHYSGQSIWGLCCH